MGEIFIQISGSYHGELGLCVNKMKINTAGLFKIIRKKMMIVI